MLIGTILSLLSAASFGGNAVIVRRGLLKSSSLHGLYVTVLLGVPLFAVATLFTGQFAYADVLDRQRILLLAVAGILHFVLGRYWNFRAIDILGANRAVPLQALGGLYAVAVGAILLGESLTPGIVLGAALLFVGSGSLAESARRVSSRAAAQKPSGSPSQQVSGTLRGWVFGLLCAVAYGTSAVLIRQALDGTAGELSMLGAFLSYCAAACLLVGLALPIRSLRRQLGVLRFEDGSRPAFMLSALCIFSAQLFRFWALSLAPISVVIPLSQARPAFTIGFSYAFNRQIEDFSVATIVGIGLCLSGTVVIAIGNL